MVNGPVLPDGTASTAAWTPVKSPEPSAATVTYGPGQAAAGDPAKAPPRVLPAAAHSAVVRKVRRELIHRALQTFVVRRKSPGGQECAFIRGTEGGRRRVRRCHSAG